MMSVMCQAIIEHLEPLLNNRKFDRRFRIAVKQFNRYATDMIMRGRKKIERNLPILPCCRAAIALKTGWSPALQEQFEAQVTRWKYGVTQIEPLPVDDYQVDDAKAVFY